MVRNAFGVSSVQWLSTWPRELRKRLFMRPRFAFASRRQPLQNVPCHLHYDRIGRPRWLAGLGERSQAVRPVGGCRGEDGAAAWFGVDPHAAMVVLALLPGLNPLFVPADVLEAPTGWRGSQDRKVCGCSVAAGRHRPAVDQVEFTTVNLISNDRIGLAEFLTLGESGPCEDPMIGLMN